MVPLEYMCVPGLAVGVSAGFLLHRSGFCFACAFRNAFMFRETFQARSLFLAAVASMVLFEAARRLGLLAFYPFPLLGFPSVTHVVGGAVFGIGMVLAGGCVVGTLNKMGAGNLPAAAAFLGLLAGSAAYAEFHLSWAAARSAGSLPGGWITIPQMLGIDPGIAVAAIAAPSIVLFLRWRGQGKWSRRGEVPRGYVHPWVTALALALLGTATYVASGMPIGITTGYAKMAGWMESVVAPRHFESLAYFRTVPLNVVRVATGEVLQGGPGPVFDAVAAIQFPLIAGVVLGSALSALLLSELRMHWRIPPRQLLAGFAGGVLMGLASRMGGGCNVWHLLGGVPVLGLSSFLFAAGLLPGAWVGGRLMLKII